MFVFPGMVGTGTGNRDRAWQGQDGNRDRACRDENRERGEGGGGEGGTEVGMERHAGSGEGATGEGKGFLTDFV